VPRSNRHQIATKNQRRETTGKQQYAETGDLQGTWYAQATIRND
jgi:hypothetical protein